jgi:hypothetical protein
MRASQVVGPRNARPPHQGSAGAHDLSSSARMAASEGGLPGDPPGTIRHPSHRLAWAASAAVHLAVLLILSLLLFGPPAGSLDFSLQGGGAPELPADLEFEIVAGDADSPADVPPGLLADVLGGSPLNTGGAGVPQFLPASTATSVAGGPAAGLAQLANPLAQRGGGLSGRRGANRRRLALAGGGSVASESAVDKGLVWLANHQLDDGSWRFDLEECPACGGACRDSGSYQSSTAATGLALLCFLGAGETHLEGRYQQVVARGIYYLQERMVITSSGGDLRDHQRGLARRGRPAMANPLDPASSRFDTMYSHGIATLALTEAYAMTRDPGLQESAQLAIDFIVRAQFADGGWRYLPSPDSPGPGDMTVSGWQITALKAGLLAGLDVPYDIWERISGFLDGLQGDGGASYVYVRTQKGTAATNAIGLLCRMIGGWPREARPLMVGVARLASERPEANNVYFNFYASQTLHHFGGELWERWNPRLRDYLVDSQAIEGHEAGSWYFVEAHSTTGGRLYITAMAIMSLEVYYRYLPLYQESFVDLAP